ncbi:MAG: hypothetical protein WAS07_06265 [Micropruina sp.]
MNLRPTTRRLVTATIAAAAVALPLSIAPMAHASTTSSGCTVTPLRPIYDHHNSAGVKVLNYRVTATCSSNRTVTIEQDRMEQDGWPNPDDLIGESTLSRTFAVSSTYTFNVLRTLPDTEIGQEEMYQKVRFRVTSNGVTSAWTANENSPVQSFTN